MKFSEFITLTQSDLFRYSGSARLKDHLYHYLLSPGYRYTWWMRFCAYSHAHPFWRILFPGQLHLNSWQGTCTWREQEVLHGRKQVFNHLQ
jgi:hypothetical protein